MCEKQKRYPDLSLYHNDDNVKVEIDIDEINGVVKTIKKTYACHEYTYDAELKTVYATYLVEGDNYWSRYSYDTLVHEQGQYLSDWFSWESRESPNEGLIYNTQGNMITGYTLHSIMILYIILYVIGIMLFLAMKCPFHKIFKSRRIKESLL